MLYNLAIYIAGAVGWGTAGSVCCETGGAVASGASSVAIYIMPCCY